MDIGTYTYMFIYVPYMCTYIHCDCQDHATMASIALAMTSALWEHTCIARNVLYNNCTVCVKCVCLQKKVCHQVEATLLCTRRYVRNRFETMLLSTITSKTAAATNQKRRVQSKRGCVISEGLETSLFSMRQDHGLCDS